MIEIGKINTLKVASRVGSEIYLASAASAKVLLVDKRPPICQVGDALEVFVYVDTEGHLAATTTVPKALVDDIAWLKVVSLNYVGAFLDWGLPKDLLVPFGEQHHELEVGKSYLVKLFLDNQNRILATTKIEKFIAEENFYFKAGQKVSLLIADKTDLGIKAIINNSHWGMLYENELFQPVQKGQKLDGFIRQIREDNKIDLTLHQPGYGKVDELTDKILAKIKDNQGFLPLSDKSPPDTIYSTFGVSKKVFKQAIGALYKKKLILIEKDGIRLI
ncbi:S1-like domain-containing RNA-binding protein [Methyloglobulus sp.]|uniref:CvfB family protein n=1 Tax=Methyloglobulus sp. TaxID=2518622 RepID=UPI0032B7A9E4